MEYLSMPRRRSVRPYMIHSYMHGGQHGRHDAEQWVDGCGCCWEQHAILGMLALSTVVWVSSLQLFAQYNVRVELRSSSRDMMLCERRIRRYVASDQLRRK